MTQSTPHIPTFLNSCQHLARALLLGLLPVAAQAASFDCSLAESPVEQTICSTPALSEQDDAMNTLYQHQLRAVNNPQLLEQQHTQWLQARAQCEDTLCIATLYENRMDELIQAATPATVAAPAQPSEPEPAPPQEPQAVTMPQAPSSIAPPEPTTAPAITENAAALKDLQGITLFAVYATILLAPFVPALILSHRVDTGRVVFAYTSEVKMYYLAFILLGFGLVFNGIMESQAFKVFGYASMAMAFLCVVVLWGYQRRLSRGMFFGTLMLATKLLFLTLGLVATVLLSIIGSVLTMFAIKKIVDKKYVQAAAVGMASRRAHTASTRIGIGWEKYVNGQDLPDITERLPDQGVSGVIKQGLAGFVTSE